MAGVFGNYSCLFRLFHVLDFMGAAFPNLTAFTAVIKRFVLGEKPGSDIQVVDDKKKKHSEKAGTCGEDLTVFVAETESLLDLFPEMKEGRMKVFKAFHNFSVDCGNPMATILVSKRDNCRICNRTLLFDKKTHVVVIYHEGRGTYLGSRVTKYCNNCKVYEHHGYWTMEGERKFETDSLQKEFLLSSEDTAVDLSLLRQFANLLVVGAVPFPTYAKSYNRRFGYLNKLDTADDFLVDEKESTMKRKIR